jgi:hypothetical protein
MTPPVVERVQETVVVRPGRSRWIYKRDRYGREIKCLVRTQPVTRIVARDVLVDPGRRVAVFTPPVYADVPRPVLLRPAGVQNFYEPPVTRFVARPVILKPAETRVIVEPPVYRMTRSTVRVRSGGTAWQPINR